MELAEGVCRKVEAQTGVEVVVDSAGLLNEVDSARDSSFARGEEPGGFFGDETILVGIRESIDRKSSNRRASWPR